MQTQKTMPKFIPDVKPGAYNWTVRILVLDKSKPVDGKNGKNGYQRLLLADQKGNKIQGMIFGSDIHHWRNHLTSHQYYDISNAIVKPVSLEYQKNGFMTQWILNNKTIIENCDEDNPAFDEQGRFAPFSTFAASIDSPVPCDVVGIVAAIRPPRSVQLKNGTNRVQEIIMIDEELLPIILSVWGTFVEKEAVTIADTYKTSYPVIMATRVKVVSYKGLSLATRAGSGIIVDSPLSRIATLKAWALENSVALKDAVVKINASDLQWLTATVKDTVPLATVKEMPDKSAAWVLASVVVVDGLQRFFYTACEKCGKSIAGEPGRKFGCAFCQQKSVANAMPRFEVQVSDDTCYVNAQFFGDLAEKHFNITAKHIAEQEDKFGYFDFKEDAPFSNPNRFIVQLKISDSTSKGQTYKKFYVNNIKIVRDVAEQDVGVSCATPQEKESAVVPIDVIRTPSIDAFVDIPAGTVISTSTDVVIKKHNLMQLDPNQPQKARRTLDFKKTDSHVEHIPGKPKRGRPKNLSPAQATTKHKKKDQLSSEDVLSIDDASSDGTIPD